MMSRALKTLLACLALLPALAASELAAQSADQTPGQTPAPGSEQQWYIDKPIKEITFKGLVTVSADELNGIVKSYIGQKFSLDPLLWELEAKLYALDYFETIAANALPGDDSRTSVVVEFTVKERPSIEAIDVTGNTSVRVNDITDKILLKKGDLANDTRLKADVEAVKSLYLEKGYTDVNVSGSFVPGSKPDTVKASFTVVEGMPTTIKEVRFSGNTFASENTLRGLMKTKAQFLFDTGVFQESTLETDKTAIVNYYADRGFIDAKIDNVDRSIETQTGRRYLILTIYLTEGEQWLYGGMTFKGNQVFSTERLAQLVYQKTGKTLSLQKVVADEGRVENLYYENGYIFNRFERSESRNTATKTINYTLNIQETDKAHIENILFKGNTRTAENVLRRGLSFQEGDIFNREKIIQGLQYLQNLQFFKSVSVDPVTGSEFGLMNVIFNVEETSTADINFGIVFTGGSFPISGTVKWNERNFRGQGQTVGVDLEASLIKQTVALSFYEPWLTGVPWSMGVSLSFDHELVQNVLQDFLSPIFTDSQQSISAPDPYATRDQYLAAIAAGTTIPAQYLMSYDMYNFTLGANTGYVFTFPWARLGFQGGYNPQLRFVDYDATLYRPFEKSVRDNNGLWNFIDQISLSAYLDGRDIYWNPTKGFYLGQSLTYTGGILFGSRDFIRTDSRLEGFLTLFDIPVFENWNLMLVAAAHTAVSFILPNYSGPIGGTWSWQTVADNTEQLYIDGMTVGRGWSNMYTYGNALWDNKFELRMPIVKEAIWLAGFFDVAGLWDQPFGSPLSSTNLVTSFNNMSLDQLFFSFGIGVRFTIPQLPIRLYFAKGFQINQAGQVVWRAGDNLNIGGFTFSFVISLGGDVF
jgi:outer membrane protein insertion porin family